MDPVALSAVFAYLGPICSVPPEGFLMRADSFEKLELNPIVLRGLVRLGYDRPTPIQEATIPAALKGRDVVGLAPTGTGKTLAYTIPLAHRLLGEPPPTRKGRPVDPTKRLRTLVLCPVRELAQQVAEEARTLVKGSVLKTRAVYGKAALKPQRDAIAQGVDFLVGTPGRLRELIDCGALSLAHIRTVVVDEGDRMLDMGFLPQVRHLLARVPAERQMMFFSATMPDPIARLADDFLHLPFRAEIGANTVVEHIGQFSMHVPDAVKVALLLALIKDADRRGVIIFVRTRRRAGWVATALRRNQLQIGIVHGNRSQAQRQRAIEQFSSGEIPVLVATDVAARGLHIPAIRTVINYDLPTTVEEYVHRVGRAGHGGGFGEAYTLVSPREEAQWPRFSSVAGTTVKKVKPPDFSEYMRTSDLERISRTRDGSKALAQLKLKSASSSSGTSRKSGRKQAGKKAGGKGGHASSAGSRKRRTEKKSHETKPKFGARGNAARRESKRRPIARGEKPGSGVRSVNRRG